jgi:hypothetical protein
MTKDEALKLALEALKGLFGTPENWESGGVAVWRLGGSGAPRKAISALEATLEQPVQEPVAYDKTEMNSFVIDLYEEKMKEGKHGHYEALFHCVHQAIARVNAPAAQREWVGLTVEDRNACLVSADPCEALADPEVKQLMEDVEAALRSKNK